MFGRAFGIEFTPSNPEISLPAQQQSVTKFVRPISPFEIASCYRLSKDLTYHLAHGANFHHLADGIPGMTSFWILTLLQDRLESTQSLNSESVDPPSNSTSIANPILSFLNGTIGTSLPDNKSWFRAIESDPETNLLRRMVRDKSLITKANLEKVHHIYRGAMRRSLIIEENFILYYIELLSDDAKYVKLRIVPKSLHTTPIGYHLNVF